MKKIIGFVVCLALAATVCKGEGFKDWFTPSGGFTSQPSFDVWICVGDYEDSIPLAVTSDIDEIGYLVDIFSTGIPVTAKNAFETAKAALISAMYAQCQAKLNECKINNLASAIEGIVVASYGEYHDHAGRVISKSKANIARDQLLRSKNSIVAGNGATEGTQDDPIVVEVLETPFSSQTFEQDTRTEGESKTILKGVPALTEVSGSSFPFSSGLYLATGWIPLMTSKDGDLTWKAWNGVDTGVFSVSAGTGGSDGKLGLKDWDGGDGGCSENLQNLLTNKNESIADDRRKHYFLTRYGENNAQTHELHWVSMAEAAMETGGEPSVDDHSIVLAQDKDASQNDPKKLRLKGFDEAKAARTESDKVPTIPNLKPTGEDVAWTSFSDFFADSVFKTSDTTGKVLLNGTKEGDKKLQVLALSYGDTDDDQTLSHFSGDGKSIDFGFTPDGQTVESPLAQLHNFDNPERNGAKTEYDISDILTNVNHSTDGWYFPLRNAQGVLQYAQASKITGIPSASVDGKTIENTRDTDASETEPTKLRIFGSQTATEGQVLKMGGAGEVVWSDEADVAGLDCEVADIDKFPLYTNIVGGVVRFGLKNWETLDNVNGVYGKKESNPVMWRMDDSRSLECDTTHDTIEVANSVNAANRAIPFKDKTNSEGDTISWLAPPSSNPNGKYLKITGTGSNTTLAWAEGGSGVHVDDASITTNYSHGAVVDGNASLYGFRTAYAGDVPHKKVDGTIEWKPVAAGGALLVQGNYDSTVVTCTNKLIFASESDSNVKFKVTQGDNGIVTVTVGVYYK